MGFIYDDLYVVSQIASCIVSVMASCCFEGGMLTIGARPHGHGGRRASRVSVSLLSPSSISRQMGGSFYMKTSASLWQFAVFKTQRNPVT